MEYRKIFIEATVGSINYNLTDEKSDTDFKQFVCPTFEDLYTNNQYSSSYTSDCYDYTVHDIRKFSYLLYKANINFVEVLFAKQSMFHSDLKWVEEHKYDLSTMNLPYLYNACIGMYHEKVKRLHKGTETTQILVDNYGYDTKQAMCAFRVLDFITRMAKNNFDFGKSIYYSDNDPMHNILMDMKRGRFTEDIFMTMLEDKRKYALEYEELFKRKEVNNKLKDDFDKVIKKAVISNMEM